MRRRLTALLLALLLLCQLAAPAAAEETVYYTAVNENVLELNDATMPFWSGGYLYVPSAIFSALDLGISPNAMKRIVTLYGLYDRSRYLLFNMNDGTVTDGQGNGYYPGAVQRGGTVFLPVSVVAKFFGFNYSNMQVNHGYLVWVTDGSMGLSDAQFADAATYNLDKRYNDYQKSRQPAVVPTPPPPETTNPTGTGKRIYLCMEAGDVAAAEELLDNLSRYGAQATFFFPPEQLADCGDLLRRMAVTGQAVGILADAGRADLSLTQQIELGNNLLFRATCSKTRLVRVEGGTEKILSEVSAAGYCVLTPTLDRSKYGLQTAAAANNVFARINARRGASSVWLGEKVSAAGLRALLAAARSADDRCLALTETT